MSNFADFLELYEKDKNYFQDFKEGDYENYLKYFDENDE
jgi:hypothetical protein